MFKLGGAGTDQVLGHEIVAEVAETGSAVTVAVGTKVMVRPMRWCGRCWYCTLRLTHLCDRSAQLTLSVGRPGGFADELVLTDLQPGDIFPLERDVEVADAIWAEPLAVALHCLNHVPPRMNSRITVFGAGPLGLCVTAAAATAGAEVTVVEPRASRRRAAVQAGAAAAVSPENFLPTNPVVYLTAAAAEALGAGLDLVDVGGIAVVPALSSAPVPAPRRAVRIQGAFGYNDEEFAAATRLINDGQVRLGHLVSHRFPLDDLELAFRTAAEDADAVKVVVLPVP